MTDVRGWVRLIGVWLCAGLLVHCSSQKTAKTDTPPENPDAAEASAGATGLAWLRAEGTHFASERADSIRLTGVGLTNQAWGQWVTGTSDALAAAGNDPLIRPTVQYPWLLTDADFDLLHGMPVASVRYDIDYELFAPDNPQKAANLALLRTHAQHFGALGIYMIVDLSMPIGLDVQSDNYERKKPGSVREQSLFEDASYFQATLDMWTAVAQTLQDLPEVAGYELVNEPRLPSDADGGKTAYQQKYQTLCEAIRAVDSRHILFVPEYNSREANPGESYFNDQTMQTVTDTGEQGIIWDRGFIPVTVSNVAYVFHLYDPYEYTSAGAATFDPATVQNVVAQKVAFRDSVGHAPLVVTEYGVNRQQTPDKRVAWLNAAHAQFRSNSISALYFTYKAAVDPYVPASTVFALYGQFVTHDTYVTSTADGEALTPAVQAASVSSGFDALFNSYFKGQPATFLSPLDNAPVLAALHDFAQ